MTFGAFGACLVRYNLTFVTNNMLDNFSWPHNLLHYAKSNGKQSGGIYVSPHDKLNVGVLPCDFINPHVIFLALADQHAARCSAFCIVSKQASQRLLQGTTLHSAP